jgi:hypothetical protein
MDIDLSGIGDDLKALLVDVVDDVTDPQVQTFIAEMLDDWAKLGLMKADQSADPDLVADAEATIKARAESLAAIPGMLAAEKREAFLAIVSRVTNMVVDTVFGVARAYLGLPPSTGGAAPA